MIIDLCMEKILKTLMDIFGRCFGWMLHKHHRSNTIYLVTIFMTDKSTIVKEFLTLVASGYVQE